MNSQMQIQNPDWVEVRETLLAENADSVLPPAVELPVLPKALMDFREAAEDPEVETELLSRIISSDAGLSAELLRSVNTCKAATRNPITSVRQALVMSGVRTTLLHLTVSSMQQAMKSRASKLINLANFWNTNLERSLLAREIAQLLGADADLAFTACMLQDFLLPLITNQLCDDYLEFTENRSDYANLLAFEQQKFGWNHAEAAAHVMHAWHFPDELVCCVCLHHRGTELISDPTLGKSSATAVAIASLMPDPLRQEPSGLERLIELDGDWVGFDLAATVTVVDVGFQEMASNVRNHFSLRRAYDKALRRLATG